MANDGDGIYIFDGATANIIGAAGARNVISANTEVGIRIVNAGSTIIQGNYIGLEADGSPATPHGLEGISLEGNTSGTVIGGTNLNEGNVVSGNDG